MRRTMDWLDLEVRGVEEVGTIFQYAQGEDEDGELIWIVKDKDGDIAWFYPPGSYEEEVEMLR